MDVLINAKNHENHEALTGFYTSKLLKSYEKYEFIKRANLNINLIDNGFSEVSLTLQVEKGGNLFCKSKAKKEFQSYLSVIEKMKSQIEKYKEVHFHSH